MSEQRPRVNFITVVWGDWHLSAFFSLNIPTLLAAGNLPAFTDECDVTYDIYTRAEDVEKIKRSQGFRWMQRLVTTRVSTISDEGMADPIRAHRDIWFEAVETAKRLRANVLLMPPDVAWSDGSFRHVGKLLRQGKKVIYNFYLRVVSDTFTRDFIERYRNPTGVIAIEPREMVDLSMRHIHPLMAAYTRNCEHFPHHPEMVIWPVRGEGLLLRVLARECLLYDPGSYDLNARALVDGHPNKDEIEFVSDSDDFFAVSLAPLGKDIEWCLQRQKIEYTWLSRWWLHYDSALNDLVAGTKIRIHYAEPTPSKWRQIEFSSDLFVRRAAMHREALRTWRALHELKCERAAELLAMAIHTGAIMHLTPARGRLVVFAPSDEAFDLIPEQLFENVLRGSGGHNLEQLIRAHLVVISDDEPDLESRLQSHMPVELTTVDARTVSLRVQGRAAADKLPSLLVNSGDLTSDGVRSGRNLVFRLEGVLSPVAIPIRRRQPAYEQTDTAEAPRGDLQAETR
jgi:hypothetical protein